MAEFSRRDAERVSRATQWVERQQDFQPRDRRNRWEGLPEAPLWAVLIRELVKGGSTTAQVWNGDRREGPLTESDRDPITVYDWLLSEGQTLPVGTRVKLEWFNGVWWVTNAGCAT